MMKADIPELAGAEVKDIVHEIQNDPFGDILGFMKSNISNESELSEIQKLLKLNGTVELQYISEIRK